MKKNALAIFIFAASALYTGLTLLFLAITGCENECQPEEMRCRDNVVELCDANGDWQTVDDCNTTEPAELNWMCCEEDGTLACIPADYCTENDS